MSEVGQLRLQLEIAEHGMAMPHDPERVQALRRMLSEARERKLREVLARIRLEAEIDQMISDGAEE